MHALMLRLGTTLVLCGSILGGVPGLDAPAHAAVTCAFSSVSGLAFGLYDPADGPLATTGTITIFCTGTGTGSIMVELDTGSAPSFTPRTLVDGDQTLQYNVFLDAAHQALWGDGTSGTSRVGPVAPALDTPFDLTMFGLIAGGQRVRPGEYRDTLTVTLIY